MPRGLIRAVAPWLDGHLPRRADRVIAVSDAIRDGLTALGAAAVDRVHVIPNGVEWECFPTERQSAADGGPVIFTGNLAPYQGVDLIRSLTVGAISPVLLVHVAYLTIMGFAGLLVVSRRLDKLLLQ